MFQWQHRTSRNSPHRRVLLSSTTQWQNTDFHHPPTTTSQTSKGRRRHRGRRCPTDRPSVPCVCAARRIFIEILAIRQMAADRRWMPNLSARTTEKDRAHLGRLSSKPFDHLPPPAPPPWRPAIETKRARIAHFFWRGGAPINSLRRTRARLANVAYTTDVCQRSTSRRTEDNCRRVERPWPPRWLNRVRLPAWPEGRTWPERAHHISWFWNTRRRRRRRPDAIEYAQDAVAVPPQCLCFFFIVKCISSRTVRVPRIVRFQCSGVACIGCRVCACV